jgi:acetyl esterase/lipase
MSIKISTIATESRFGVTTHHLLMSQSDSADKLLIMLPGRGYTTEHPVMYYLRKAALNLGYDVLSIEYGFQAGHIDLNAGNMPYLEADIQAAVASVSGHDYQRICVAGKSMGTPLAVGLAQTLAAKNISLLLLTPVTGAAQMAGTIPALAIIGTADYFYQPDAIRDTPTLKWRVFEGLDHSLENKNDWHASLAVLPDIITACAEFLS